MAVDLAYNCFVRSLSWNHLGKLKVRDTITSAYDRERIRLNDLEGFLFYVKTVFIVYFSLLVCVKELVLELCDMILYPCIIHFLCRQSYLLMKVSE